MTLNYVTLTLDLYDGQGNYPVSGTASFTPSAVLTDAGVEIVGQQPVLCSFHPSGVPAVKLLATDNSGPSPAGWTWSITFSGVTGAPSSFSFFLPFTGGASQLLSNLIPVSSGTAFQAYMPLPTGTPTAGQVPVATGSGEGSAWGSGAGAVSSVFGRTGSVAATSGDYAVAQVTGAAPLDSPVFTGTPAAPTQTAGDSSVKLATTAFVSAATAAGSVMTVVRSSGDATGVTDTARIQAALLGFGTLGGWSQGAGGIVFLAAGAYFTNQPLIIPSGVTLAGAGPWVTTIRLVTGSNCDVIQWATYNSSAQAAVLGVSAGSIINAFYAALRDINVHGDAFATTTAGYCHGINITMNPADTTAPADPDFDPLPVISNVITEANTGDGFFHSGRSGALLYRVTSEYNNGNGFTPSYDTTMLDCLANKNGVAGFYLNHFSMTGAGCKSYNNGQGNTAATWTSGHSYTAGQCVISSGVMYFCILATSGTTAPGSDATHWTALSATSPAAWGNGYYWDSAAAEQAWAAADSQQNSASNYYLNSCICVNIQGASDNPNFGGASNPNNYAHVQLISSKECTITLACSRSNGLAYIYNFDKNFFSNQLIGTSDGTETAMFPTNQGGVFTIWNGVPTFLKSVALSVFNITANSYQDKAGTNCITQGSGAPANPTGSNPAAGDIYLRTDTPSTLGQRVYICTTGGASPVWAEITAALLPLAGGTMSGAIAMGSSKITGLANGTAGSDAAAFGQTPAGGNTATIGQGGTGQTSAAAAYNALSPMTTLGDIEYESGASTASRLAGNTTATKNFLTQTGTGSVSAAPAWGAIAAADLPAGTTSTQGALQLDGTAGDIKPTSTAAAAGAAGKAADASHVHVQDYLGIFGTGADGTVTLDGITTFNGFSSLAGSTYTLTRDVQAASLTVNNGVTLKTAQFRVFCKGTLTNSGTISNAGNNASGSSAAGGTGSGAVFLAGRGGAAGGTGVSGAGGNASSATYGGNGGNGGAGTSGAAGSGGTSTITNTTAQNNLLQVPAAVLTGVTAYNATTAQLGWGCGGGGGGSDASSNAGGGGGGGGGVVAILAWALVNGGTVTVAGGNGANGTAGNAGGGGGGAGGAILTYTLSAATGAGTYVTSAGTHGTGSGTGSNGVDGAAGLLQQVVLA